MNGTIGLSEEKVNAVINQANSNGQSVIYTLGSQMQSILDKLGEDWGTKDSITYVDNDIKPTLEKLQQSVAAELKAIGDTIKATAVQQAQDTQNDFSGLEEGKQLTIVQLSNKQQEKLSNGYVGALESLSTDIASINQNLKQELKSKLENLKSTLTDLSKTAFLDQGSTVANKVDQYVESINVAVDKALQTLLESIENYTKDVVKFVQDVQGEWKQVESTNAN